MQFVPLLALGLCACGGGPDAADETAAPAAPQETAAARAVRWDWLGATTDDPNADTAAQADAFASLPRRIALRVVLDAGTPPADYVDSVRKLAAVADVMALPLDSSEMSRVDAAQAGTRAPVHGRTEGRRADLGSGQRGQRQLARQRHGRQDRGDVRRGQGAAQADRGDLLLREPGHSRPRHAAVDRRAHPARAPSAPGPRRIPRCGRS